MRAKCEDAIGCGFGITELEEVKILITTHRWELLAQDGGIRLFQTGRGLVFLIEEEIQDGELPRSTMFFF